jgi:hypothetical protein
MMNNAESPQLTIPLVICRVFGHKWKYNFPSLPNKAICTRCKSKAKLDLHTLDWESVKTFEEEKRTDKELCRVWVS